MIDFHSHILPELDDGSKSPEESIAMLECLKEQGVSCVVATPHFSVNYESTLKFIERRKNSYNKLKGLLTSDLPRIVLGAEVSYYEGISKMENLSDLCIEGTQMLLLEMPSSRWSEYVVNELYNLSSRGSFTPVIAHIERYLSYQSSDVFDTLLKNDVLMQVNSDFVTGFFTKHKALSLFKKEKIHFIGSDCHNMTTRPPEIRKSYDVIEKKLGKDFLDCFVDYGNGMLM